MARRAFVLLPLLAVLGCGGTVSPQAQKTVDFIKAEAKLKDAQLARVCPSLYPSDFLKRYKHYRYDQKDLKFTPTARQKAAARAAGCTDQGTKPKD